MQEWSTCYQKKELTHTTRTTVAGRCCSSRTIFPNIKYPHPISSIPTFRPLSLSTYICSFIRLPVSLSVLLTPCLPVFLVICLTLAILPFLSPPFKFISFHTHGQVQSWNWKRLKLPRTLQYLTRDRYVNGIWRRKKKQLAPGQVLLPVCINWSVPCIWRHQDRLGRDRHHTTPTPTEPHSSA